MTTKQKQRDIEEILRQDYIDPEDLRGLGLSKYGFLNNKYRRLIWPKLLGFDDVSSLKEKGEALKKYFSQFTEQEQKQNNPYYEQIQKDISRSLIEYGNTVSDEEIQEKRNQLKLILNFLFFRKHIFPSEKQKLPDFHYFQGFHDVISVFLLILGEDVTLTIGYRLCNSFLRDALDNAAKLDNIVETLKLIHAIIARFSPQMSKFLKEFSMQNGDVVLSWILTWFVHVIEFNPKNSSPDIICRIFDAALSSHPLFLHYFAASMIIKAQKEIFALKQKPEGCSFSDVYSFLVNLPKRLLLPSEYVNLDSNNSKESTNLSISSSNGVDKDKKTLFFYNENEIPQYPDLLDELIDKTREYMDFLTPQSLLEENPLIFDHISKRNSHVTSYPHSWASKLLKSDKKSNNSPKKAQSFENADYLTIDSKKVFPMPKFLAEEEEFSGKSGGDKGEGNSVVDTVLYWSLFSLSVAAILVLG